MQKRLLLLSISVLLIINSTILFSKQESSSPLDNKPTAPQQDDQENGGMIPLQDKKVTDQTTNNNEQNQTTDQSVQQQPKQTSSFRQKIASITNSLRSRLDDRRDVSENAIMADINRVRGNFILNKLTQKPPLAYSFSGYLKQDNWFDSYQVDGMRQDQYLLFPDIPIFDQCGRNINKKGRFNMVDIETRVRAEVVAPKIFGAYPFGAIEGDFEGDSIAVIGLFRLRHAFIYLEWPKTSLLIGQYWHPVFIPDCYPDTISYNNGAPIEPFEREPQVRITSRFDNITLTFAATSYAGALIDLPNPTLTQLNIPLTNYTLRNSVMPDLNFQMRADVRKHFVGVGFNMRRLIPRLYAPQMPGILAVRESLISFLGLAYAKLNWEKFSTCS